MKRRGLINWKAQLTGAPPANQQVNLGASVDQGASTQQRPSKSPVRSSGTNPAIRGGITEFQASLYIHEQQANVLRTGLDDTAQQVYLGDNVNFKPGDIVEVVPVLLQQSSQGPQAAGNQEKGIMDRGMPSLTNMSNRRHQSASGYQKRPNDKNVVQPDANGADMAPRTSLVVYLNQSFYKANQQQKKLYVSIDQTLAELHGLRKDMQVYVRKIDNRHLQSLPNSLSMQHSQFMPPKASNPGIRITRQDSRTMAKLTKTQVQQYQTLIADRVEVTIRDQFVSRRDMWNLVQKLNLRTIHKGYQIDLQSIRFKIRNIYTANRDQSSRGYSSHSPFRADRKRTPTSAADLFSHRNKVTYLTNQDTDTRYIEQNSAIVTTNYTRFSFFTKSCQVYCLIELSKEMYSFDSDGFLQAEKTEQFVRAYLERCKADGSTHEIVFILYARIYYPKVSTLNELLEQVRKYTGQYELTIKDIEKEGAYQFSKNKIFQDVYLKAGVVNLTLDTTKTDYEKFLMQLKQQIQNFPHKVNWQFNCPNNLSKIVKIAEKCNKQKSLSRLPCELGDSERTNILEVINLALFNLNNEETDLNLRTTGTQMLILTAGLATYRVNSGIISPTKERLILGGVQIKMISFAREPPYKTPLFLKCCQYTNPFEKKDTRGGHHRNQHRRFNVLPSPDGRASPPMFSRDYGNTVLEAPRACPKKEHQQSVVVPDWMSVTYLPHIKLLETHFLTSSLQRKTNALLKLSKTALIAPQFCSFQQVNLVTQVFNGLVSQDERLFHPHSMFTAKIPALKERKRKVKAEKQESPKSTQGVSRQRRRKIWRMDPEMYQLRRPTYGGEKYLLQDAEAEQAQAQLDKRNQINKVLTRDDEALSDNDESQDEVLALKVMSSLKQSSLFSQSLSDPAQKAQAKAEASRKNLKKMMREYDGQVAGQEINSTVNSMTSSPTKYELSPVRPQVTRSTLIEKTKLPQLNSHFEQSILINSQHPRKLLRHQDSPFFNMQNQGQIRQALNNKWGSSSAVGPIIPRQKSELLNTFKNRMKPNQNQQPQILQSTSNFQQKLGMQTSHDQMQDRGGKARNYPPSFQRRWGHAIQTFQLSLFGQSNNLQRTNMSDPLQWSYSLSYDQLPELGGFDRRHNAFDLAITQNYFDPLCKLMDPFWRQLSDVMLIPLTSSHFPDFLGKTIKENYNSDSHQSEKDTDVSENLCLRLTQNFQLVNPRGCCDLQLAQNPGEFFYKMAFRDIYAGCEWNGINQFETQTHFKYNEAIEEAYASFKYLLYSHHTKMFHVKKSQESRLFTITKLKNLDLVQSDLLEAKEHCIKLPQVSFVILYDRSEARKLRNETLEIKDGWNEESANIDERNSREETEEQKAFEKLRNGLVTVLQSMGPNTRQSFDSLKRIKVIKMSTIIQKNDLSKYEESEQLNQMSSPRYITPYSSQAPSQFSSAQKQYRSNNMMASGDTDALSDDQGNEIRVNKWPQDIMGSFLGQQSQTPHKRRESNYTIPEMESSCTSISNQDLMQDQMNLSMQVPNYAHGSNLHESIINQGQYQNHLTVMMQSNRVPPGGRSSFAVRHGKGAAANDDKAKNSKKCIINLYDQNRQQQQQTPNAPGLQEKGSQFLLEHDAYYATGACFHLKFQWIFACGPEIQERVIKRLLRQVKELSNGCFKLLPLSEIVRSQKLNPFESETLIRSDYSKRQLEEFTRRNVESTQWLEQQQQSALMRSQTNNMLLKSVGEDFSLIIDGAEEELNSEAFPSEKHYNRRSRLERPTFIGQNFILGQEKLFQKVFPRILTEQCGFVLDSKSKDEKCTYFLERETGLAYLRFNTIKNKIKFSENDIVNNTHGDYQSAIKVREKVEATIIALDILLSLIQPNVLM